jgi:hypothetical protein
MKLTWKDVITTLIVIGGGAVVYAKYYNYSWAVVGSWRSAVAVLALGGILMFAFSSFNFANRSTLNVGEMVVGALAIVLAVVGMIVTRQSLFYSLAVVLGVFWLVDTARHVRHSVIGHGSTTFHHHVALR